MMHGLAFDRYVLTLHGGSEPLITLDRVIAPGQCLAVMGASGGGKSTLLLNAAGFATPWATASGSISCGGERLEGLPPWQRHLGLMFQDDLLFPHLSVGDNLLFGLPPEVRGKAARRAAAEAALREAGLDGMFERAPKSLSGGQRSRVSLLRTLLSAPRALLLDEPFSRLDMETRDTVRRFTFDEARRRGLPVLLVTHDARDAEAAGAEIVRIGESAPFSRTGEGGTA